MHIGGACISLRELEGGRGWVMPQLSPPPLQRHCNNVTPSVTIKQNASEPHPTPESKTTFTRTSPPPAAPPPAARLLPTGPWGQGGIVGCHQTKCASAFTGGNRRAADVAARSGASSCTCIRHRRRRRAHRVTDPAPV